MSDRRQSAVISGVVAVGLFTWAIARNWLAVALAGAAVLMWWIARDLWGGG